MTSQLVEIPSYTILPHPKLQLLYQSNIDEPTEDVPLKEQEAKVIT